MKKEIYNKNIITKTKRVLTYFADAVIFLIFTILIFSFGTMSIVKAVTPFNQIEDNIASTYEECRQMLEDSHLLSYTDEGQEQNTQTHIDENLKKKLVNFTYNDDNTYVDIFYHFYLTYNNSLTYNGEVKTYSFETVNTEIYKYEDNKDLFVLTNDDISLPMDFSDDAKTKLNAYLNDEITGENQALYNKYVSLVVDSMNKTMEVLGNSDQFIEKSGLYNSYVESILSLYALPVILTFTICFFIYYLLVPILLKKGQTPAKKILHVGVFDEGMNPIKPTFMVFRAVLQYLFYFHLILFIPYLQLGSNVINIPLFSIGNTTFYLFHLVVVTLLITIVDFIFMLFNLNNRTLRDKVSQLIVLKDAPIIYDLEEEVKADNVIEQERYDRGS